MGREMAGAAAAAGWAAAGRLAGRWPSWPAEAALRVMTAAAAALPTAVMLRRSFGYYVRDVLIVDKGHLRSARDPRTAFTRAHASYQRKSRKGSGVRT